MDRVVTIKGSLSAICQAADKVYTKLKACHEADMQSLKFDVSHLVFISFHKLTDNKQGGCYVFVLALHHVGTQNTWKKEYDIYCIYIQI